MAKAEDLYGRPWSEREYIIVLDHYFQNRNAPRHTEAAHIKRIAQLLGRTAASVVMRMENFASLDPDVNIKRKGLIHVNPLCRKIFYEYSNRLDVLAGCAQTYAAEMKARRVPSLFDTGPFEWPKAFGKYELLDLIGEGTFAGVFSCISLEDGKLYAIKMIRGDVQHDEEYVQRFLREIKALKTISYPNIIRIYDDNLETENERPAYVMDLAELTLFDYLQEQTKICQNKRPALPLDERCSIFRSIIAGAEILHSANPPLIHRDINPHNILRVPKDNWVLADFSLSKSLGKSSKGNAFFTQSRKAWGTPYWGAPEQYVDFRSANQQADIHALGKILWDLFSDLPPPPRPERERHGLPDSIAPVYLKATEYDKENRYTSISELRTAFEMAVRCLLTKDG